jgi:probable phosphoglycerate mutase
MHTEDEREFAVSASEDQRQIWLIRHGETEWSLSGAHTGRTDIPLTENGKRQATAIGGILSGKNFSLVLTSPMLRARETCRLAGFCDLATTEPDLHEWDYGIFEGRKTAEIQKNAPNWSIWSSPIPGGEALAEVGDRARRVIARAASAGGDTALFAHGHILRILAACWLGLSPEAGRLFALEAGSISILGYERECRVIRLWNRTVSETSSDDD